MGTAVMVGLDYCHHAVSAADMAIVLDDKEEYET